jgi:hypothetical protein
MFELLVVVVVVAPDGGVLDGAVHAFDLAVGPRVLWLGEAVFDAELCAGVLEGMSPERLAAVEVFLVRIDGALRDLDASVRKGRVAERPGLVRLVLIGGAGVASVGLCAALAIHAFG